MPGLNLSRFAPIFNRLIDPWALTIVAAGLSAAVDNTPVRIVLAVFIAAQLWTLRRRAVMIPDNTALDDGFGIACYLLDTADKLLTPDERRFLRSWEAATDAQRNALAGACERIGSCQGEEGGDNGR